MSENTAPKIKGQVLLVDDDHTVRFMLVSMLEHIGFAVLEAQDGDQALQIIKRSPESIDMVLLDQEMPKLSGMELLQKLKASNKYQHIPIIMLTGHNHPDEITSAIDAGIFYYLTKPIKKDFLSSVIHAASRTSKHNKIVNQELERHQRVFKMIDTCEINIKTIDDALGTGPFIAEFFNDPNKIKLGIIELLKNAIEHGNLGIGLELKTQLLLEEKYENEIAERLLLPENINKSVKIKVWRDKEGLWLEITDQGEGFDHNHFLKQPLPAAEAINGRGIIQAATISFDKIEYNDKGNQVTVFAKFRDDIEW
jgi:two-component system cell cycle response regulator